MNSDSRQPDAGSTSQARHPALLAHQQQQQQQPPARGNSLFEEVQWAPALKDALPSPSLAATSSASNELSLRQSSLDALNKYNTQAAVLQHDLYGQNPAGEPPSHNRPEPLNASNLASATSYPHPLASAPQLPPGQLSQQWGFLTSSSSYETNPMQAVAAAANEDPFRAYTPSYSSFTSSFEENVFPSTLPNAQQGLQQQQQQQQPQQQSLGIHQPQPVQGWRDRGIYDDSYSLYSTSSISRSTSPAISSFHGTPAMQPADHQPFEVTGSPSPFAPPPNVISPQPALWSLGPSMAERDATVQFPQSRSQSFTATGSRDATMGPPTQQHPDPHPSGATNFLGQGLSTSPTASPRIQFQDVSSTASGGNGSYPKTGSLSKLDIPCTPSIDVEAATATAGPGTARPGAHISTQLDRMIAQSQGGHDGMTALQMPISSDIRPHSMVSHVGTFSTTPEGHPSSNFGLSASTTVQPHLGLLQPQSSPSWAATRRSRSHSETDLSFMVPQQQQQPQHLPHQEPHRLWSGSSLPGVDPQSVNHSVPSFPSFPSFQSSAASSRQNSQEDANLFNNQRESLVGPRRSSNASERERPPWTPYDELTGGASIRSDSGELPAATSSAAQFAPLTSSLGHRRAAMSEDLTQMPSSVSFFNSAPAFPTPPYQQSVSPSPGPSLQQPSQQYPFQPMSGASLFDGASSYLPANTAYPSAGSLNECPSPALSSHSDTPDLQDASQQLLSSSFGSAESSEHDFSAIPVHTASQTTMATKEAAARRRKPGTDAKYLCHYCGETFTRNYNLRGHMRAHNGAKPFKCTEPGCDKAFARSHDLRRHADLHTTVSKYKCHSCSRAFKRLDALQRHHRSEAGQNCAKALLEMGITDPKLNGIMRSAVRL